MEGSAPRMADLRNATAQARSDKRNYPQHASAPGYTCTHKGTARATEGLRQRRNHRWRSVATKLEPRSKVARAALSRGSGFVQWHRRAIVPIDLGTAEILATTDQEPPSSKPGANGELDPKRKVRERNTLVSGVPRLLCFGLRLVRKWSVAAAPCYGRRGRYKLRSAL